MSAAAFSAGAATVLAAWQLVPQVTKLRGTAAPTGLSPTWAALGIVTNCAWLLYRSSQGLWLGLPSPAIAAVLYVVTLGLIARPTGGMFTARMVTLLTAVGLAAAGMTGGWTLLGTVLGCSGVAQAAPSVWAAFRSSHPRGIAPGLWLIGLAQAMLWGHYGWVHTDAALVLYGCTTTGMAIVILARYHYTVRK